MYIQVRKYNFHFIAICICWDIIENVRSEKYRKKVLTRNIDHVLTLEWYDGIFFTNCQRGYRKFMVIT